MYTADFFDSLLNCIKGTDKKMKKGGFGKNKPVLITIVALVVIAAMIYITLHSSNANVINYEVNLQDKYASWQEELQSQEESLNARERALNQQK